MKTSQSNQNQTKPSGQRSARESWGERITPGAASRWVPSAGTGPRASSGGAPRPRATRTHGYAPGGLTGARRTAQPPRAAAQLPQQLQALASLPTGHAATDRQSHVAAPRPGAPKITLRERDSRTNAALRRARPRTAYLPGHQRLDLLHGGPEAPHSPRGSATAGAGTGKPCWTPPDRARPSARGSLGAVVLGRPGALKLQTPSARKGTEGGRGGRRAAASGAGCGVSSFRRWGIGWELRVPLKGAVKAGHRKCGLPSARRHTVSFRGWGEFPLTPRVSLGVLARRI